MQGGPAHNPWTSVMHVDAINGIWQCMSSKGELTNLAVVRIFTCFFAMHLCVSPAMSENPDHPNGSIEACQTISYEGTTYAACTYDAEFYSIKLFHSDPDENVFQHFDALDVSLEALGQDLIFAMNAGMYHFNRDPVGLFIEDGIERTRINRNSGPGNFHLLPNGVFYLDGNQAGVAETETYVEAGIEPDFATQSGPMLVIDGTLHPRFIKDGTSRKIRNGVGVSNDGKTVTFVKSEERVNFYDFGRLFRDKLSISNALFLDGSISRIYVRDLDRNDPGRAMGPIVGVIEDLPAKREEEAQEKLP